MSLAGVHLWGTRIGAVAWDPERELGRFEYDPEFLESGIEVAPLAMPLSREVYAFPELGREAFRGLPGLLADSLPDRFGNALIDAWLARQGRTPDSFDPVERLCYVGRRGMGALEYQPELARGADRSERLDVASLVELAGRVLAERGTFHSELTDEVDERALQSILQVGTSAGGARAKAVIAWNPETGEVRSGQVATRAGFSHWILKFDGVSGVDERELGEGRGYGRIEYAYHLMARAAGIEMQPCRLLEEGGRAHFLTRRFDRTDEGDKLHMQSLGALLHLDFNLAGAHSYEQALGAIRRLGLGMEAVEQQFRRAVFNVLAWNRDDHVKNIAFLMDRSGRWSLSPAFDLTFAHNPAGRWTGRHQMSLAGRREDIGDEDFEQLGRTASMGRGRAAAIVGEVREALDGWPEHARRAEVPAESAATIGALLARARVSEAGP